MAGTYSSTNVIEEAFHSSPYSSSRKELYNRQAFIVHAASHRQGFPHCGLFLAAASRRSLGRVSVPVWPFTLSGRLSIVALVGHYPTNKLMDRRLISKRHIRAFHQIFSNNRLHAVLPHVSMSYPPLGGRSPTCYSPVRHCLYIRRCISRSTCMLKTRRQRSF